MEEILRSENVSKSISLFVYRNYFNQIFFNDNFLFYINLIFVIIYILIKYENIIRRYKLWQFQHQQSNLVISQMFKIRISKAFPHRETNRRYCVKSVALLDPSSAISVKLRS